MVADNISVSGQHLTLESRAATLPEIKPCLSRNARSPRSNKELIDELIAGRPTPKQFLLKWPPDHLTKPEKEKRGLVKSPLQPTFSSLPRHKWGATEIEALIRQKLHTQGYQGIKQIFQVHQLTEHPETIKRDSFSKVVYHLCGYFTKQQIDDFLTRIGFADNKLINFDDFISKFSDHQVIKDVYVSPATRKMLQDPRFHAPKESSLLDSYPKPSYLRSTTAPFAVEQIRASIFQNRLTVEDMFPKSCLRDNGLILPPQLREALASQGFDLEPNEFWGLWRRYDLENVGAIPKNKLFHLWGLDKNGKPKLRDLMFHRSQTDVHTQRGREHTRLPTAHSIALDDLNDQAVFRPSWETDPKGVTSDPSAPIPKSMLKMKSKEFMAFLREKFEAGSQQMVKCFEKYDTISCGQVSLATVKKVLSEVGIECEEKTLDQMNGRLDIPCDENGVYYHHFISILSSRAELAKIEAINKLVPDDNSKEQNGKDAGNKDEDDAKLETAITDFLAASFLAILAGLREADKEGACSVEKGVVMSQLEKHLKFSLSPAHKQLLENVIFKHERHKSDVADGAKVAYMHFMKLFTRSFSRQKYASAASSVRSAGSSLGGGESGRSTSHSEKEPLSPAWGVTARNRHRRMRTVSPKRYQKGLDTLKELQENPTEQNVFNLPITMLEMAMQEVSKNKIHSLHKAFMLLTKNGKRLMNKLEFTDILSKIGVPLSPDEIDRIWALLPLEQDTGEVALEALVARFTPGHPSNASALPDLYSKRPIPVSDEELVAQAKQKIAEQKRARKLALLKAKPARCGKGDTSEEAKERGERKASLGEEREKVKEIMIRIKPQMSEHLTELRAKLRQEDSLGTGCVKRNVMENLFHQHRLDLRNEKEADLLCRAFDINANGNFHYLRFLELYLPPVCKHPMEANAPIDSANIIQVLRTRILAKWKNLRRGFTQHDVNGDGYLQKGEFLRVLRDHGIVLSEEDLYHLMSDIDENMDGKLSYSEFLKYFLV
ncbi:uncharacterized protein LOC134845523 isoform X3 [Symsagittifera roscoffensis]|uniref:uncharacterized protein LOC134845523 isoform X3 n=1 Tax=Symsagittifera roscoffensis TaxID=84072 RepID=UPI00307C8C6F